MWFSSTNSYFKVSNFGLEGEIMARKTLSNIKGRVWIIYNRLLPLRGKNNRYAEIDVIIISPKGVFCVELKRLKGHISYFLRSLDNGQIEVDTTQLYQVKKSEKGKIYRRTIPNPMEKTKKYAELLKNYLTKIDPWLKFVPVIPVVAFFDEDADISSIHTIEDGIIYVSEIPIFLDNVPDAPEINDEVLNILLEELSKLRTWDWIITKTGEFVKGFLMGEELECLPQDELLPGRQIRDMKSILIRKMNNAGKYLLRVTWKDGRVYEIECSEGEVEIESFGRRLTYDFSEIYEIVIGN